MTPSVLDAALKSNVCVPVLQLVYRPPQTVMTGLTLLNVGAVLVDSTADAPRISNGAGRDPVNEHGDEPAQSPYSDMLVVPEGSTHVLAELV